MNKTTWKLELCPIYHHYFWSFWGFLRIFGHLWSNSFLPKVNSMFVKKHNYHKEREFRFFFRKMIEIVENKIATAQVGPQQKLWNLNYSIEFSIDQKTVLESTWKKLNWGVKTCSKRNKSDFSIDLKIKQITFYYQINA